MRRLRARLRDQRGYSIVELLISMSILGAVMTSVSVLLVSATNSEVDMNRRFQAQTEARLGLDLMRREVHCAVSVTTATVSSVTLSIPATCPTVAGNNVITWCAVANGANRWGLWRYPGASSCSGTGRRYADYLKDNTLFVYTPQSVDKLAFLSVRLPVNIKPSENRFLYTLEDDIVFRNSTRS